jgi:hypothetical protein
MKVYHFIREEHAESTLRNKHIKISELMELNDPFEFLGVELSDKKIRYALNKTKEQLSEVRGILCFSRNWSNPVQWSHYASNHKGICLGFEIDDSLLSKVDYIESRYELPQKFDESFMNKLLTSKFNHWVYEDEYRMFVDLDPLERSNGLYFKKFDSSIKLTDIFIGYYSDIDKKKILETVGKSISPDSVVRVRPAFKSFNIVIDQRSA